MKIKLVSTKAINIVLTPCEVEEDSSDKEMEFSFDFNPHLPENETNIKTFIIAFLGEMKSYKEAFECKVVFVAQFQTDEVIEREFLKNKFALINAPAIGYPYFRAFFSNLLLNAGYEPYFLPTINFVNLKEKKEKELAERE